MRSTLLLLGTAKLVTVVLTTLAFLPLNDAASLVPRNGISVMIVGDSISQGRQGDYTWRYRLWQWFTENEVAVSFVGPYTGTEPPPEPAPPSPPPLYGEKEVLSPTLTSGSYASDVDSAFLANDFHSAVWGRQVAQDQDLIASLISDYSPEYLLVELGFNDLGWFISGPEGTILSMGNFISNARSAKSDIKFAIANIPMRTFLSGREDLINNTNVYNALLDQNILSWYTDESPVYLVDFREKYSCEPMGGCAAGTDGLHPNNLGEYQIARTFVDTLYGDYGIGKDFFTIPDNIPDRPCDTPGNIQAMPSPAGVTVTWDPVFGAYSYDVQVALQGGNWSTVSTNSPRYDTTWTVSNFTWQYNVRATCGDVQSSWTDTVSATAHPTVAPGPSGITVSPNEDGISLTWDVVEGDDIFYSVLYWDTSVAGSYLTAASFPDASATITGLPSGDFFELAVNTWEKIDGVDWAGIPAVANGAIIGGLPQPPTNFKVVTIAEGATVQMTWDTMAYAAGYRIWTRYQSSSSSDFTAGELTTTSTCYGATDLFPGAWEYEFCITAFNGNYETALTGCQVAPPTISTVVNCPVAPLSSSISATPTVTWTSPTATNSPAPSDTPLSFNWPANHDFVGYGDSYAAGIGAGDWVMPDYWDLQDVCYRGRNAYPYIVADNISVVGMYHLACTGAVAQDLIGKSTQRDKNQIELVQGGDVAYGWATLSIGGNDAGFGKIASHCLLWDNSACDDDLTNALTLLNSDHFKNDVLNTSYHAVMSAAVNEDFLLIVTGYQQFFDTSTNNCDKDYLFRGRFLTQDLRMRVNNLVQAMNNAIQAAVTVASSYFPTKQILYFDTDSLFEKHRFCTPGQDWEYDAWFLTISGFDQLADGTLVAQGSDPSGATEIVLADAAQICDVTNDANPTLQLICEYAIYLENGGEPINGIETSVLPGWIMKVLHPKSVALIAIGKGIASLVESLSTTKVNSTIS